MNDRKEVTKAESNAKALTRTVRTWGGVTVGVGCMAMAFLTRDTPAYALGFMLVACAGFGIADFSEITSVVSQ